MYSRILIPPDGSELAEQVLPYARLFAAALQVPVELLKVMDPDQITALPDPRGDLYVDTVLEDIRRSDSAYLSGVARSFDLPSRTIGCVVDMGKPEDVVIERAATDPHTLIAMATRGRSGIQRWLLGSVAEKVVHHSGGPVLIIRAAWPMHENDETKLLPGNRRRHEAIRFG